ncbi:uncharacterized protein LOC123209823 isoform X2 [Mangifera indica]|uniref:uncharacterized protein LOC123209823 isoform X2 n=1 Tax=Mangifera indica TaxID=29780 RepID=UPI001CFA68CB|nr:uncharacterized protein LOC123209823 isoform X2 [Mangifera indica]
MTDPQLLCGYLGNLAAAKPYLVASSALTASPNLAKQLKCSVHDRSSIALWILIMTFGTKRNLANIKNQVMGIENSSLSSQNGKNTGAILMTKVQEKTRGVGCEKLLQVTKTNLQQLYSLSYEKMNMFLIGIWQDGRLPFRILNPIL